MTLFLFDRTHPLLFTQFYFWAFFAIVFAFFALFRNRILLRNAYLFFASLFFYYKTCGLFVILLLSVIVINYFSGRRLHSCRKEGWRKTIMVLSVAADLLLLAYFKYAYFITDLLNGILGTELEVYDIFARAGNLIAGEELFRVDSIILPVGISFFIFQAISYIVDIKRRRIEPVRNFLDFGFYLSFFPQLVAGPIVRASEFIPQIHKPFNLSRRWFGMAVFWILNGLVKKLVLSDYIAVNFCDRVFENPLLYTGFENLCALFGYSLQIYADFSGYTDIATGVALLMGFYLPKNFNSPYKARSTKEFWKRWHITLSKWLQDYLYIPLGGNRNATAGTYICIFTIAAIAVFLSGSIWVGAALLLLTAVVAAVARFRPSSRKAIVTDLNLMNTMLLGGLWHGASWNFMIWGGLNGIGMLIYKFWDRCNVYWRGLSSGAVTLLLGVLCICDPRPVWNFFFVWSLLTFAGAAVAMLYHYGRFRLSFAWLGNAWAVLQTLTFLTFTRIFFRSGSNLDPAGANEKAWNTATGMIERMGGAWDLSVIPDIIMQYRSVFVIIVIGMIIHWIPERFKRRYRIAFMRMPLFLMAIAAVIIILAAYQFITADLQSFVYFQF